ncbi:hypothetical protein V2G26_011918 [Clonostachys chloroleuca]
MVIVISRVPPQSTPSIQENAEGQRCHAGIGRRSARDSSAQPDISHRPNQERQAYIPSNGITGCLTSPVIISSATRKSSLFLFLTQMRFFCPATHVTINKTL